MKFSRHLELQQFLSEIRDLRIVSFPPTAKTLERLEQQRILIPKIRVRYPDAIERRWYAKSISGRPRRKPIAPKEPNGPRWKAACALEAARHDLHWHGRDDPFNRQNPFDSPNENWKQFIQFPERRKFVPWTEFRVRVDETPGVKRWHSNTVVTYYSTWQLLLFLECHDMGAAFFGNTDDWDWETRKIPESWVHGSIRIEPMHSLRAFRQFRNELDAVVWFTEEDVKGEHYVLTRSAQNGRREIDEVEQSELERRSLALAKACRVNFRVTYPRIVRLIKFLCERWDAWDRIGYSNHTKAYKVFIAKALTLARYLNDAEPSRIFDDVGRVTGHFKPTLSVIFKDWAAEWREDAERLIVSFGRPDTLLKADFTAEQANAFLDFVEAKDLFEFYWRWKSLNERAFSSDHRHLAGLKSDLQGMALSVEHIVHAMLKGNISHPKQQLFEKFKQVWPVSTAVGKLLKTDEYRNVSQKQGVVDLDWFDAKQSGPLAAQIASDLVICHAIRGNAHHQVAEARQLRLERMSLILLRGVVRTFVEASKCWPTLIANTQH